ncbi:MAG: class I SAM-dependent methyltransferase, partial [Myxococcales bacterium]|nr:class I SAM-dependent methyltransferase [Myxococcales bacterium]
QLDARDAALATGLVYGTLRVLPALDAALDAHLPRPERLDPWARAAMRVAAYQILHLPRIPVSAAVNECVGHIRRERGKLSGVANAVLRKIPRPAHAAPPTHVVAPAWIAEALGASLGEARAAQALALPLDAAESARGMPVDLRALVPRDALAERLRAARPEAEIAFGVAPACLHVWRAGDPRTLPGYDEGAFTVQEQGSQLIGALVGARPGELVLDACAGHGGKTAQLAHAVGLSGRVIAADLHEPRLERGEESFARLQVDAPVETFAIDWTIGDGGLGSHPAARARGGFDRVLVDAPCSGLGTLRRRPEILLRVDPTHVAALAATQLAILRRVAPLVRPGGALVSAVCSPLAAESAEVAEAFEAHTPAFARQPLELGRVVGAHDGELSTLPDGSLALGPWLDGCDAYRVIAWTRPP